MTLKDIVCRTHPSNLITVINYLTDEVLIETDTPDRILAFFDSELHNLRECLVYKLDIGTAHNELVLHIVEN